MSNLSNFAILARAVLAQARRDAEAGCAEARAFLEAASRGEGWPGLVAELAAEAGEGGVGDAGESR